MKQGKSLSYIFPQALVLHEDHPASKLDFRIQNRLMDVFYDNLGKRKISRSALINFIEVNPIHVIGSNKKPRVISGWSRAYAAKLFNIDEELPCVIWKNISKEQITKMSYLDFFIDSALVRQDAVAKRIRSICLENRKDEPGIRDFLGKNVDPRNYYNLPAVRTKAALESKLKTEETVVQQYIREHFEKHLFNK